MEMAWHQSLNTPKVAWLFASESPPLEFGFTLDSTVKSVGFFRSAGTFPWLMIHPKGRVPPENPFLLSQFVFLFPQEVLVARQVQGQVSSALCLKEACLRGCVALFPPQGLIPLERRLEGPSAWLAWEFFFWWSGRETVVNCRKDMGKTRGVRPSPGPFPSSLFVFGDLRAR